MNKVRFGIIGVGNMGYVHLKFIMDELCPNAEVTAFADIDIKKLERAKALCPQAKAFMNPEEMLDPSIIDAVLIAVPHYDHPKYAILAFQKGIHVLIEKPAGVFTRQVREMNEMADQAGVKFAIMFNQRTSPIYAKAKEIVASGQLGELKRLVWIVTNWYRTQSYYDSGSWRATWRGEGGGVLLNQAPHNLDLWQWIFGMPKRIRAFCEVGKYHHIQVEDDVTIYGASDNGATATFISTTGEAPGTNRLEISGDLGKIVLEEGKLKWWKLQGKERDFCFTATDGFYVPPTSYEEFTAEEPDGHPIIINNFCNAILFDEPLIADGREGINSLSISNAAYLSTWNDDWVELPVDEEVFERHLKELAEQESQKGEVKEETNDPSERWKIRW